MSYLKFPQTEQIEEFTFDEDSDYIHSVSSSSFGSQLMEFNLQGEQVQIDNDSDMNFEDISSTF